MKKHKFYAEGDDELLNIIDSNDETTQVLQDILKNGYWSLGEDIDDRNVQNAAGKFRDLLDEAQDLLKTISAGAAAAYYGEN